MYAAAAVVWKSQRQVIWSIDRPLFPSGGRRVAILNWNIPDKHFAHQEFVGGASQDRKKEKGEKAHRAT